MIDFVAKHPAEAYALIVFSAFSLAAAGYWAIGFFDFDIDAIINNRKYANRCKACVTTRVRIEWRNTHQAMHAGFGFQPAIGIMPFDEKGGPFDAGFFAIGYIHHIDFEFPTLRPARVHTHEHTRPILAFRAAGTGMNFKISIILIGFT